MMKRDILKICRNPITLQCTYRNTAEQPEFVKLLDLLSFYGFYGIELNLPYPQIMPPKALRSLLDANGLSITYIATGAYAHAHHLSLSSPDLQIRKKSIQGCKENIRYAAELQAGIIIGFLKNSDPLCDKKQARMLLEDSLTELNTYAGIYQVPILLEATNRYESCIANSLNDTMEIIDHVHGSMISILPDTYHMNIEESQPFESLAAFQDNYRSLHLSDNNRYFPGLGCIPFDNYFKKLDEIRYQGILGIEGTIKYGIPKDLEICVNYLSGVFEHLQTEKQRAAS